MGVGTAGACKASTPAHEYQKENSHPSKMFLLYPLLTKLNIVPTGKGKMFKRPRTLCREKATRVNLELRNNIS